VCILNNTQKKKEKELTQKEILNLDEDTNGVFFPSKFGDKEDIRYNSFENDDEENGYESDSFKFQHVNKKLSSNGKLLFM
jgi:hypothetical protein